MSNWTTYDETGRINGLIIGDEPNDLELAGRSYIEGRYSTQTHHIADGEAVEGALPPSSAINENKNKRLRAAINRLRDSFESSPVLVNATHLIDADEKSEARMKNAILLWDILGQETIAWTLADNSVVDLSKDELQTVYDGMIQTRGIRGLVLHQYAATLKSQLPNLAEGWDNQANWPNM